jgi:predicted ribosomally synthesized peptide with nif11-like leader
MSEEQLKAFLEKVKADTSLQEKLKAAADANAVAAIAKEAGFMISADDLAKAQSELSEDELEAVAGGTATLTMFCAIIRGNDGKPFWDC